MKAVTIVMGLLRVVGNRAIKKMSLKIEKHEQIARLAVSALNAIIVSFQKHYQMTPYHMTNIHYILLEFETFARMKEDLRIKT